MRSVIFGDEGNIFPDQSAFIDFYRAQGRDNGLILGCEPNERSLRFGLERGYRALARLTSDRGRRGELVDMANAVRPKTWS